MVEKQTPNTLGLPSNSSIPLSNCGKLGVNRRTRMASTYKDRLYDLPRELPCTQ